MRQDAFESCCGNVTKYKGSAYGEVGMLDANLLCKFVLQMVEKHLRLAMAV